MVCYAITNFQEYNSLIINSIANSESQLKLTCVLPLGHLGSHVERRPQRGVIPNLKESALYQSL